jgi:hypothetical protein
MYSSVSWPLTHNQPAGAHHQKHCKLCVRGRRPWLPQQQLHDSDVIVQGRWCQLHKCVHSHIYLRIHSCTHHTCKFTFCTVNRYDTPCRQISSKRSRLRHCELHSRMPSSAGTQCQGGVQQHTCFAIFICQECDNGCCERFKQAQNANRVSICCAPAVLQTSSAAV